MMDGAGFDATKWMAEECKILPHLPVACPQCLLAPKDASRALHAALSLQKINIIIVRKRLHHRDA